MKCGLIGAKLSHSYSPLIHSFFGYQYDLIEREINEIPQVLADESYSGFNVTVPYKEEVIKYLDEVDDSVKSIGACNTILRRDGKLIGFNTDFYGLKSLLKYNDMDINGCKVLILGSGGTSKTAQAVCNDLGGRAIVVSRNGKVNYANIYAHADAQYIINTTPYGMSPNVNDKSLIDLSRFNNLEGVVDVVFNPLKTALLYDAHRLGIKVANGLFMLVMQGVKAGEIFSRLPSRTPPVIIADAILKQATNIVLIGMPSSGKSTIGKALAQKLGATFIDTDTMIEARVGMTCGEFILSRGEDSFREVESQVLDEATQLRGAIVATGGGAVLRQANRYKICANSCVVFLKRELDQLSAEGRPLSKDSDRLKEMYQERLPIYQSLADVEVENIGAVDDVVMEILRRRKV